MNKSLLILAALLLSFPLNAFPQLSLEKTDINLIVKPGEKVTGNILIKNGANEDILLKDYFEDLVYPPPFEGLKEAKPLGTSAWSFGGWASVTPSGFILPASGRFMVAYTFDVPVDARGGYYGVLLFERGSEVSPETGLGIDVKIRTGVRFYLETANSKREGKIEDVVFSGGGLKGSLLNSGDVLLFCKLSCHIMDSKGKVVKRAEFERVIPPQERASFMVGPMDNLSSGSYTLFINCGLGEKKVLVKEVDFIKGYAGDIRIERQKE